VATYTIGDVVLPLAMLVSSDVVVENMLDLVHKRVLVLNDEMLTKVELTTKLLLFVISLG